MGRVAVQLCLVRCCTALSPTPPVMAAFMRNAPAQRQMIDGVGSLSDAL